MAENLTKKERRELRRQEWQEKLKKDQRSQNMKKYLLWGGIALGFLAVLVVLVKVATSGPSAPTSEPVANFPAVGEGETTYGTESAKLVMVEYSDFQCPACGAYYPVIRELKEEYKDQMLFVYRNFPLRQVHPNAGLAAQAAYAAHLQGKFWEMHNILFDNQSVWSSESNPTETFTGYAKTIGLDEDKFTQDLNSDQVKDFVSSQERQAFSLGVNSTPTFFLNNRRLVVNANYEEFKKVLEEELAK